MNATPARPEGMPPGGWPEIPAEHVRPLAAVLTEMHGAPRARALLQRLEDFTGPNVMVPTGWWTQDLPPIT